MTSESADYLAINRANWDSRAPIHAQNYGIDALARRPVSAVERGQVRPAAARATSPASTSSTCSATSAPTR